MAYKVPCDLPPLPPTLLSLSHSIPSLLVFLLFLKYIKPDCTPLNLLSLPGMPFLQISTWFTPSLPPSLCSSITLSILNSTHLHHCPTFPFLALLSFVAHITTWLVLICSWSISLPSPDYKHYERRDWTCFVYRYILPPSAMLST